MAPVVVIPRNRARAAPTRPHLPAGLAMRRPALGRAPFITARPPSGAVFFLGTNDATGALRSWPVSLAGGIGAPSDAPGPVDDYSNSFGLGEYGVSPDLAFVGVPGRGSAAGFSGHVQNWAGAAFGAEQLELPGAGVFPFDQADRVIWSPPGGAVVLSAGDGLGGPNTRGFPWAAGALGAQFAPPVVPLPNVPTGLQFAPGGTHIAHSISDPDTLFVYTWTDAAGWGARIPVPADWPVGFPPAPYFTAADVRWSPSGAHVVIPFFNNAGANAGLRVYTWSGAAFGAAALPVNAAVNLRPGATIGVNWHPGGAWIAGGRWNSGLGDFQFMPFDGLTVGAPLTIVPDPTGFPYGGVLYSPDGEFAALLSYEATFTVLTAYIYSGAAAGPAGMALVGSVPLTSGAVFNPVAGWLQT